MMAGQRIGSGNGMECNVRLVSFQLLASLSLMILLIVRPNIPDAIQ